MVIKNLFFIILKSILVSFECLFLLKRKKSLNKLKEFKVIYFLKKYIKIYFILEKKFNLKNKNLLFYLSLNSLERNLNTKKNYIISYNIKKSYIRTYISSLFKKFQISNKKKLIILNTKNQLKKKFKVFSFLKNTCINNINNMNFQFIRKFRVFNKGRYSRNRQFYRTGVYWCLYIHIIAVVGIYFWFYKITMNFNYLWLIFYLFIFSFIWSRLTNFLSTIKLYKLISWNFFTLQSILESIVYFFKKIKNKYFVLLIS